MSYRLTADALASHNAQTVPSTTWRQDDDSFSDDSLAAWRSVYLPSKDTGANVDGSQQQARGFNQHDGDILEEFSDVEDEEIVFEEELETPPPRVFSIDQEIAAAHRISAPIATEPIAGNQHLPPQQQDNAAGDEHLQHTEHDVVAVTQHAPYREGEMANLQVDPVDSINLLRPTEAAIEAVDVSVQVNPVESVPLSTSNDQGRITSKFKNTSSSSFSDIVRRGFIERMERKGSRSKAFSRQKYFNYYLIVKNGPEAVPPPMGYTRGERKWFVEKRRKVANEFVIIDDELYRKNSERKVILIEDALDAVDELHSISGHSGCNKTWIHVKAMTWGIVEDDVIWLVKHCKHCGSNEASVMKAPLNPIESFSPMERVQMDLVDLRKHPSGDYHWYVHLKDHFGKTSWVYPLNGKYSVPIAKILSNWMRIYGIPQMIQCDNGKEFKGAVIRLLKKRGVRMVNGRPRHTQSQGLVEQGNGIIKRKITKWKAQNDRTDWAGSLDLITKAINSSSCQGLPVKYNPHHVMYAFDRPLEFDEHVVGYGMTIKELSEHWRGTESDLCASEDW